MIAEIDGLEVPPLVILVETSHPGNIGAAARAMKTMGLRRLVLVAPKYFPAAEATARASGADDILASAVVVDTLEQALRDCHWVIGVSARRRDIAGPECTPSAAIKTLSEQPAAVQSALVFGREQSGLSNTELDRCHRLCRIPANPQFGSLNLASAVQIMSYEWRLRRFVEEPNTSDLVKSDSVDRPAPGVELERFFAHLQSTLAAIGFFNRRNTRHLMRRFRRMFNRIHLEQREVNIMRGMLSAIDKAADQSAKD